NEKTCIHGRSNLHGRKEGKRKACQSVYAAATGVASNSAGFEVLVQGKVEEKVGRGEVVLLSPGKSLIPPSQDNSCP
ncbi:hypothetical protein APHAL10511_003978, partial [Amanita phalloides]